MARKQARKKREPRVATPAMPKLNVPWRPMLGIGLAFAFFVAVFQVSAQLLDRPIRAVDIEAPMQRVSSLQIQASLEPYTDTGFITADLDRMREALETMDWVDAAVIRRRWPDRLQVLVVEQVPAARWQQTGLLNTRGELFVSGARHIPAELPRLSGPDGTVAEVAKRYLAMNGPLIEAGLKLASVTLDERDSWELQLTNGVVIRMGRRDVDVRAQRFIAVASTLVARQPGAIDFVDMRYSNGFSVGWKNPEDRQQLADDPTSRPVLAAERGEQ